MKIDVRSKESVYITINEVTYYIDDSTNEQIVEIYAEGGEIEENNGDITVAENKIKDLEFYPNYDAEIIEVGLGKKRVDAQIFFDADGRDYILINDKINYVDDLEISSTSYAGGGEIKRAEIMLIDDDRGEYAIYDLDTKEFVEKGYSLSLEAEMDAKEMGYNEIDGVRVDGSTSYAGGGEIKDQLVRVLKDSGFNHIKGKPLNEYTHNRGHIVAVVTKDSVHLSNYTPNTHRFLDSTSFDNPKKLAEYFDKNQIYAQGGSTYAGGGEKQSTTKNNSL